MLGVDSEVDHVIAEVDIYKWDPWELPAKSISIIPSNDSEWFFLCPRKSKYSNKNRFERSTKSGHWKITGQEQKIKGQTIRGDIGKKKILTFHEGRGREKRNTNWVMHEYHPEHVPQPNQKAYVICRLKLNPNKNADTPNRDERGPLANISSDFEMQTDNLEFYTNETRETSYDSILNSIRQTPIYSDEEIDIQGDLVKRYFNDDPDYNFNWETTHNISNFQSMPISSMRAYFEDGPSGSASDSEAANGQGKVVAKRGSDVNLPEKKKEKEMSTAESNNERKIVKGSNVEKHSKFARLGSSRPQAEYIFNTLVGMLVFLVFARKLVLHGTWC